MSGLDQSSEVASTTSCKQALDTGRGQELWLSLTTMSRARPTAADPKRTALDRDALAMHEAVADLVRVYQFRDRDRICCHDVSSA